MINDVLDASAMFALINQEPGADLVAKLLESPKPLIAISSVNFCEVFTKLTLKGASSADIEDALEPFSRYIVDFSVDQAMRAGELARATQAFGLSLGDRACLALAESLNATAWTTDRIWLTASLGIKVQLIR